MLLKAYYYYFFYFNLRGFFDGGSHKCSWKLQISMNEIISFSVFRYAAATGKCSNERKDHRDILLQSVYVEGLYVRIVASRNFIFYIATYKPSNFVLEGANICILQHKISRGIHQPTGSPCTKKNYLNGKQPPFDGHNIEFLSQTKTLADGNDLQMGRESPFVMTGARHQ